MNKINFFVINLERDSDRLANIIKQFELNKDIAKLHIVKAIDGKHNDGPKQIWEANKADIYKNNIWGMSAGEIACYMSHQKALNEFLQTNENFGIILEDDIHFTEEFWKNIVDIKKFCEKQTNLFFNFLAIKPCNYFYINKINNLNVVQYAKNSAGAACYFASKDVAKIIVNKKITQAYDFMTKHLAAENITHMVFKEQLITLLNCQSSIDANFSNFSRPGAKRQAKKEVGVIKYKLNRIIVQTKYQYKMLKFNIQKYGLIRTIKVWIKSESCL